MTDCQPVHVPVMLEEVVHWLDPQPGQVLVDGTLGGGGHTRALAERVGASGLIVALDRDPAAIRAAERNLADLPVRAIWGNFCDLPEALQEADIETVDGVLLDLGVSSDQLADRERGFSFDSDGPLDLRMNPNEGEPAWRLIERLREKTLADLIFQYGEERHSRKIARRIVRERQKHPIRTSSELARLVRQCGGGRRRERIDPATRTFQALRIAVNDEIKSLEIALRRIPDCIRSGGKLVVISFHSLEDRPTKHAFRNDARLDILTRRPIRPTAAETDRNPRARSAKMRVARRL